jgi:hypothetical protein
MATITTRVQGDSPKGSPLTNAEVDNNFINLNTAKYESGDNVSFGSGSFSSPVTLGSNPSNPGELRIKDNSTTDYSLYIKGTGTRGYKFEGSSSSASYTLTFANANADGGFFIKTYGGATFNEGGIDQDFRVESDANTHMLFVDAGNSRVGVGVSDPYKTLEVGGDIQLNADDASIWLKSGATGKHGYVNWTYNTDDTVYAKVGIDYDTRASTGFHIDSGYPITIDYSHSGSDGLTFAEGGTTTHRFNNTGAIFNEGSSISLDFRVESDSKTHMLFVDAGSNKVGINNSAPASPLDVIGDIGASVITGRTYSTGTIASTNPNIVTGSGFNSIPIRVGDEITFYNNQVRTVTSVTDTQLTVDQNWTTSFAGVSATGKGGISVFTNAAQRFRINADGTTNVGAGANSAYVWNANGKPNEATVSIGSRSITQAPSFSVSGLTHNSYYPADFVIDSDYTNNNTTYNLTAYGVKYGGWYGNMHLRTSSGTGVGTKISLYGAGGVAINEDSLSYADFRVESDAKSHMLFVDAGNNAVGINVSEPNWPLQVYATSDLGSTLYDYQKIARFSGQNGNQSHLDIIQYRAAAGSDWYSASTRIQQSIDSTEMGYIQFNGANLLNGVSIGSGGTSSGYQFATENMRFTTGGITVNEDSLDRDFRVESENNTHMLFVDAYNDTVNIGGNTQLGRFAVEKNSTYSQQYVAVQFDDDASTTHKSAGLMVASQAQASTTESKYNTAWIGLINRDPRIATSGHGTSSYMALTTENSEQGTYGTGRIDFYIRNSSAYSFPNTTAPSNFWMPSLFQINSNGAVVVNDSSQAAGDFRVESDNNTHALFVDAGTSRVGINKSAPSHTLDVYGTQRFTNAGTFGASNGNARFLLETVNGSVQMKFSRTNNVDTTYETELGSDNDGFHIWPGNYTGGAKHTFGRVGGSSVFNEDSGNIDFRVESDSNSNMFHVDADAGDVTIGNLKNNSAWRSTDGVRMIGYGHGTSGYMEIVRSTSSDVSANVYMARNNDGRMFSFNTQTSSVGEISITASGTTYNTTSDRRLKDNIETVTNGTAKVMAMNPVTHTWIADPDAPTVHGFIAQEMQEIIPEAVSGTPDGEEMMSMDYGRITPVLVAALQDAHKKIAELEARLNTLEGK